MEILKFISFGSWSTYVKEDDLGIVTGVFVTFCIMLVLKALGLWLFDAEKSQTNTANEQIVIVLSRLLHVSLYFLLLTFVSLAGNLDVIVIYMLLVSIWILIVGIIIITGEKDPYLFKVNEWYRDFITNTFIKGRIYSKATKANIKRINLKINEYKRDSKF